MKTESYETTSKKGEGSNFLSSIVFSNSLKLSETISVTAKLLSEIGVDLNFNDLPVENCVMWRSEPVCSVLEGSQRAKADALDYQGHAIAIVFAECAFEFIASSQGKQAEASLLSYGKYLQNKLPGKRIVMVFYDVNSLFRKQKKTEEHAHRQAVLSAENEGKLKIKRPKMSKSLPTTISRLAMEEATIDLNLKCGIDVLTADSPKDLADIIFRTTRAVNDTSKKQDRLNSALRFCCDKRIPSVAVKSDEDLKKLWRQQLSQFKNISTHVADAIVSVYPTQTALLNAYAKLAEEQDRANLLEKIEIHREIAGLQNVRCVGKEFSQRLHRCLTSSDPNEHL